MNTKLLKTQNNHTQGSYVKWLAILLMFLPMFAKAQFDYTTNSGTITITRYYGSGKDIVIPSTLDGLPVTVIGQGAFSNSLAYLAVSVTFPSTVVEIQDYAFYNCRGLTNVTIPDSVVSIGRSAFLGCYNVRCVSLGAGVQEIGQFAFYLCHNLQTFTVNTYNPNISSLDGMLFDKTQTTLLYCPETLTGSYLIPETVRSIGDYAFYDCRNLTNVILPSTLTNIGLEAFQSTGLTSIDIPNGVTTLGKSVFETCRNLGVVTIPSSITTIPARAFCDCGSLTNLIIPDSITNIDTAAFAFCESLTNIAFPISVVTIGDSAFFACKNLLSLTIPDNIQSIGDNAFSACRRLVSVVIGTGITNIGTTSFWGCYSLEAITVSASNPEFSSSDGILYNKAQSSLIQYPPVKTGPFIVPNSVVIIEPSAFAFSSMTSLTIPDSVTSFGKNAFFGCSNLSKLNISASVTNIGTNVFYGCSELTNITVNPLNQFYSSCDGVLFNKSQTSLIDYPDGMAGTYHIPKSIGVIYSYAFHSATKLTGVIIPDGVTNIQESAFEDCQGLTNVTIPRGVKELGSWAFGSCTNLTGVFFEGDAPNGDRAFGYCFQATAYYLPGKTGWNSNYYGIPAVLWNPTMQTDHSSSEVGPNGFGFTVTGTADIPIVIEACSALGSTATPLQSLTLTNGQFYFSDPDWKNNPTRFYRIRSP